MFAFKETPSHAAAYLIAHGLIWSATQIWHLVSRDVIAPAVLIAIGAVTGVLVTNALKAVRKRAEKRRRAGEQQIVFQQRLEALERRLNKVPRR